MFGECFCACQIENGWKASRSRSRGMSYSYSTTRICLDAIVIHTLAVAVETQRSGQRPDLFGGRIPSLGKRETDRRKSEGEAGIGMKIRISFLLSSCSGEEYYI